MSSDCALFSFVSPHTKENITTIFGNPLFLCKTLEECLASFLGGPFSASLQFLNPLACLHICLYA